MTDGLKGDAYLACPACLHALHENRDEAQLACTRCGINYPIEGGVPILRVARPEAAPQGAVAYPLSSPGRVRKSIRQRWWFGKVRDLVLKWLRFEEWAQVPNPLQPSYHLKAFARHFRNDAPPRAVLDVGGGRAPYKGLIAPAAETYWVLEVDRRAVTVRDDIRAVIGDVHELPFQADRFELVLMTEVLEHLYDPSQAIQHCARTMKPGGVLIVTTPQYWHLHGWPSDYYRFTNFGLAYLCERNGLEIVDCRPMGGPFLLLYSVLVLNFIPFIRLPVVSLVLNNLALVLATACDWLFFRGNLERPNPDTRGWAIMARKPEAMKPVGS